MAEFEAPVKKARTCPKLKLYYFDIPGLGEIIRLACAYGNLPWEDVRLAPDQFQALKAEGKLSFGQLPALCVDDETFLFQSAAIMRFVGKYAGLYPTENDVLAAQIDALVDQEKDMFAGLNVSRYRERYGFGTLTPEVVTEVRQKLSEEVLPRHLSYFETYLQSSPSGWLLGGERPTIADFIVAVRVQWLVSGANDGIAPNLLDSFPGVKKFVEKFHTMPEVLAYYEGLKK